MERPAKRPRHLFTPLDSNYGPKYSNPHAYYEIPDDEVDGYDEPDEDIEEHIYNPDQELQMKRAQADFKLKSTFEAIFEKYGKDFDGVGDEIDMRTGEILVNNGHIISMRHEADPGEIQSQLSEELDDDIRDSRDQDSEDERDYEEEGTAEDQEEDDEEDELGDEDEDEDEEDYEDDDPLSDEEMVEDDMILRGFAQASQQFIQRQQPHDPGPSMGRFSTRIQPNYALDIRSSLPKSSLPSRSEILAQFGPNLGPEIAKYVSDQGASHDRNIEPAWRAPDVIPRRHATIVDSAWRTPDLGSFRHMPNVGPAWRMPDIESGPLPPAGRPLIKSMVTRPEIETDRSVSPENATSIWAAAVRKPSRRSAPRQRFQPHEDQLLLDFAADARRQGLDLGKASTWRLLEAMNPHRDHKSWKRRYNAKFTYLRPSPHDELYWSASETSSSAVHAPDQRVNYEMNFTKPVAPPIRPINAQRPARARKPAQREGIVSWSEAIATIASVDPVGNAGLLDDVRRTGFPMANGLPIPSMIPTRRHAVDDLVQKRPVEQPSRDQKPSEHRNESVSGAEDELHLNDSAYGTEERLLERAPCPHADCRSYPTTLYRLERGLEEELSPMCSHLLYEHHITPFPCGEANCERKGARGYFMQSDLIGHVRNAHPHAAALYRLRGRVDSALLDRSFHPDQARQTIELDYGDSSGKRPRDSDFMVSPKPYSRHGLSTAGETSVGYDQGLDSTPRAGARAAPASPSSMHVHPSPGKIDSSRPVIHREVSMDSDLQILEGNPFLENESFEEGDARNMGPESLNINKHVPALHPATALGILLQEHHLEAQLDRPHNDANEQTTTSHFMQVHSDESTQKVQPDKEFLFTSRKTVPMVTTFPTPQSSVRDLHFAAPLASPEISQHSRKEKDFKPTEHEERSVDRAYELSDDDDGIRPVLRRPRTQSPRPQDPPLVPQSFFAPPAQVKSPTVAVPLKNPAAKTESLPLASNLSFATPSGRPKSRKRALHDVLASEEFDELSFGENGFILLSARPRSGKIPNFDISGQIKDEDAGNHTPLAASSKKRLFKSIEKDDDIDELAGNTFTSSPLQRGPNLGPNEFSTTILAEAGAGSTRNFIKPKSRKRFSGGGAQPGSALPSQPVAQRHHHLPARTGTPLLNLIQDGPARNLEIRGSRAEIPSTSELTSSPSLHQTRREPLWTDSRLAVVVTPHKTWANRTVKVEELDSIITPGGTARSCGLDGFVCGRAFCFRCDPEMVA